MEKNNNQLPGKPDPHHANAQVDAAPTLPSFPPGRRSGDPDPCAVMPTWRMRFFFREVKQFKFNKICIKN